VQIQKICRFWEQSQGGPLYFCNPQTSTPKLQTRLGGCALPPTSVANTLRVPATKLFTSTIQRPPTAFKIDEATRPLGLGEEGIDGVRLGYVQMTKSKEVAAIKEHTSLVKAWNEFNCMYDSAGKGVCRTLAISTDARSPFIAVEAFLDLNTLNYDVLVR
jgi:hypothetical protein